MGNSLKKSTLLRKKARGLCLTPSCTRPARDGRNYCCTCQDRKWKKRHPIRALYARLKGHALERGKAFTLTPQEWFAFCLESGYHELKGRRPEAMTVDRIDPSRGYEAGNIRALSHAENSLRQDAPPPPDLSYAEGEEAF